MEPGKLTAAERRSMLDGLPELKADDLAALGLSSCQMPERDRPSRADAEVSLARQYERMGLRRLGDGKPDRSEPTRTAS